MDCCIVGVLSEEEKSKVLYAIHSPDLCGLALVFPFHFVRTVGNNLDSSKFTSTFLLCIFHTQHFEINYMHMNNNIYI